HTRCYRDWSSDVCSSDLNSAARNGYDSKDSIAPANETDLPRNPLRILHLEDEVDYSSLVKGILQQEGWPIEMVLVGNLDHFMAEIGRASCRERVGSEGRA